MRVLRSNIKERIVYTVKGAPDAEGARALAEDISRLGLDGQKISSVLFDLSGLKYMTLSLMRTILICRKRFEKTGAWGASAETEQRLKGIGLTDFTTDMSFGHSSSNHEKIWDSAARIREETPSDDIISLFSFSDTFDPEVTLRDYLKDKVNTSPDSMIIRQHGELFTWKDIDRISDIIAADLASLGVRKNSHVGLCGLNSVNWICALFAVRKLGAMAVLADPRWRRPEMVRAMNFCQVTHFCCGDLPDEISSEEYIASLSASKSCRISEYYDISSKIDFRQWYGETVTLSEPELFPDEPCAVVFTFAPGSEPNSAIVSEFYLLTLAKRFAVLLQQTPVDVSCQGLLLFSLSGLLQFLHVSLDDIITCIPENADPDAILETIGSERCSIMHAEPEQFTAIASLKKADETIVSPLRACMISDTGMMPEEMRLIRDIFPKTHFIRFYGLREMGLAAHTDFNDTDEHLLYSAGHPDEDTDIRIWDPENSRVCPAGESGEILVRCYYCQSSVYYGTSPKMQNIDGEGFFHTGDTGFISDDGYLHITGRKRE